MSKSRFKNYAQDKSELLDLARTVTEVEYLLLLLVLLYVVVPGATIVNKHFIILSAVICISFIVSFHYAFHNMINRSFMAIESLIMTGFITYVIWNTGKSDSPLVDLYLIVIIASALTLGRGTTILLVFLATVCLLYFDYSTHHLALFSPENINDLMRTLVTLYTLLLIAYLTMMLSSHMERARNRIKILSERDELTGLLNMRAFTNLLAREHKQCSRYNRHYGILMADADNLKIINDQYGHAAGDNLIISIADALQATIRGADVVARYGGDEYIVLLPETDRDGAIGCAERLRRRIESTPLILDNGKEISTSVSIGIACYPADGSNPEEMVNKADRALYNSKKQGKNQITLSDTLMHSSSTLSTETQN